MHEPGEDDGEDGLGVGVGVGVGIGAGLGVGAGVGIGVGVEVGVEESSSLIGDWSQLPNSTKSTRIHGRMKCGMGISGQSHENRTSGIVGTSHRTSPPTMGSTVDDPSSLVVVVHANTVDSRPATCWAPKPGGIVVIVDVSIRGGVVVTVDVSTGGFVVTVDGSTPGGFVITVDGSIPGEVVVTVESSGAVSVLDARTKVVKIGVEAGEIVTWNVSELPI